MAHRDLLPCRNTSVGKERIADKPMIAYGNRLKRRPHTGHLG
jgi:hypothetical protein